ncbi:Putative cerato-ulmin hydrophobin family, Hydrophobin superfamily [Septoria linicola]|uniref:Cerato-ulmin hydrophobin family, Hydrophobin superfamily n=1 Tax=Septoria linicola TaxID=215465 RepID=A0A9Q9AJT3_9PEZI|nr:putative cerato-ulmin hydrophobin family, Hydrophobin superfamily [Septoria linicola]USW49209.1 Putative cerato-ulmin hydrophobin family, Hydrophobin superfamily [Septoria linicola]
MQFFVFSLAALATASPLLSSYGNKEQGSGLIPSYGNPSTPYVPALPVPGPSQPGYSPTPEPDHNGGNDDDEPEYPVDQPSKPPGGNKPPGNGGNKPPGNGGNKPPGNGGNKPPGSGGNGGNGGNGGGSGGRPAQVCPSGWVPQCCQTNVLGVVGLQCGNVPRTITGVSQFQKTCAKTGHSANCCIIPALGQGIICNQL